MSKKAGYFVAFCLIVTAVFAVLSYQEYNLTVRIKKIIVGEKHETFEIKDVRSKIEKDKLGISEPVDLINVLKAKKEQLDYPRRNVAWLREFLGIITPVRSKDYKKNVLATLPSKEASYTLSGGAMTEADYPRLIKDILKRIRGLATAWGTDKLLQTSIGEMITKGGPELERAERKDLRIKLAKLFRDPQFMETVNLKMILVIPHMQILQYISEDELIGRDDEGIIKKGSIINILKEIEARVKEIKASAAVLEDERRRRDDGIEDARQTLSKAEKEFTAHISTTEVKIKELKQEEVRVAAKEKKEATNWTMQLRKLQNELDEATEISNRIKDKFDTGSDMSEDGKITDVDTKVGLVWIDLTVKDKILPGMKFKVFAKLKTTTPTEKGEIIVKRVGKLHSMCIISRQFNPKEPFESGWSLVNQIYVKNPSWKFIVLGNGGIGDFTRNNVIAILKKMGHHVDEKGPKIVPLTEGTTQSRLAAKYGITTETQMILLCKGLSSEEESDIQKVANAYGARVIRGNEFINMLGLPEN